MTAIQNSYVNAFLADAAYVDLVSEPLDSQTNGRALSERMTPTLAAYIAANFEVASSINSYDIPLVGSGFDATVWRGKDGGAFAGQVFLSARGTEPRGADLLADGDLALIVGARSQIIDMVNWWLRESTASTEKAKQVIWQNEVRSADGQVVQAEGYVLGAPVSGTGNLLGITTVQVNGHSLGGHLASAFSRIFGGNTGALGSVNVQSMDTFNSAPSPALPAAPTASRCPSTHARHSPRKTTDGVRTQIGSRHCGQRRRAWVRGGDSLHARCEAKGSEPVECVVRGGQA